MSSVHASSMQTYPWHAYTLCSCLNVQTKAEGVINTCVHLCLPVIISIPVEHTPAFQSTDKIQYPVPANRIPITSACRCSLRYTSTPEYFPYVALPKQDLIPGGAQGCTDLAPGKETYLLNETMKACAVLVTHTDSMGDQYNTCFHCSIHQICFFPILSWVTVCPPVQHILSLFHSTNMFLSLGPSDSMGDSVSTRATHASIVSFINLSSAYS